MYNAGNKHACTSDLVSLSTEQLMNDIAVLKIIHALPAVYLHKPINLHITRDSP